MTERVRVAIVGASGYTGAELVRLLLGHPGVALTLVAAKRAAGQRLDEVFPHLRGLAPLPVEAFDAAEVAARADVAFAALPHGESAVVVAGLRARGVPTLDLSADFRLHDGAAWAQWYGSAEHPHHPAAPLLAEAVYGLPELYRERVRTARLTANPGCYPTSVILALTPLLRRGLIDPATLIIDSKSGTSGAGRAASVATLFCEVTDGFRPYKVGGSHRHIPEIEQELSAAAGRPVTVSFTPHLLPISRGILSTIYASLTPEGRAADLQALFESTYADEPFVRVLPAGTPPATQHVRGSNCCDLGLQRDERTGRLIVMSAIDNIVKGASGQAVQNMNLMLGFPETTGLMGAPFFP